MSFNSILYNQKSSDYYSYAREDMFRFVPKDVRRVLDIGCSSGGFGKLIKDNLQCEVWGVEPTSAAAIAAKHLDKVYHDYFHEGLDFGEMKFDLIVFNDVLEHLVDPWAALDLCKKYISEKGSVLASIPNVQCYTVIKDLVVNGNFRYTSSGVLDKTHLRFFTKNSIVEMFSASGYDVQMVEGMHSIVPYSRLLKFLKFIAPAKSKPFTFMSYGVLAKPVD